MPTSWAAWPGGAINAPALAHRNMWRPGLMSQEGKKQYTEAITETKKPSEEEKRCFIATVVYGNAAAPEVNPLTFRTRPHLHQGVLHILPTARPNCFSLSCS